MALHSKWSSGNLVFFDGTVDILAINKAGSVTVGTSALSLTTATTALNAFAVYSDFTGTASTYHIANFFNSAYTGTGTGSLRAVVGQVDYSGTQTTAATAQYIVGVHGRAKVSGTAYNTALCITGVHGQILSGGTYTKANHVSAIWADNHLISSAGDVSNHELIYMTNNNTGSGSRTIGQAFYLYGVYVTNLIYLDSCTTGGMVSDTAASAVHGTSTKKIKISIDGTTYYLLASTTPTT